MKILTTCPTEYPGVRRVFEDGESLGMWRYVPTERLSLPLDAELVILGGSYPPYHVLLDKIPQQKWILWTSPLLQTELAGVEMEHLLYYIREPRVSRIWFGDRVSAGLFPKKGFYCHPEGTKVHTSMGMEDISLVRVGDLVLTHTGAFQRVSRTFERRYVNELVEVLPFNFAIPILATPEHPFRTGHPLSPNRDGWTLAGELRVGDFLVYRVPHLNAVQPTGIDLRNHVGENPRLIFESDGMVRAKNGWHHTRIPRVIPLNAEMMEFSGFYLAEGGRTSNGNVASFTFAADESSLIETVRELGRQIFGLEAGVYDTSNVCQVAFCSKALATALCALFGNTSVERRIPSFFLGIEPERLLPLIRAFWLGDGCLDEKAFLFSTSSPHLANALKMFLLRLGLVPRIYRQKRDSTRTPQYTLKLGGPYLSLASRILNSDHPHLSERNRTWSFSHLEGDRLLLPIRGLKSVAFSGQVYNIEVENDGSYLTETAISHNCPYPVAVDRVKPTGPHERDGIGLFVPFQNKNKNVYSQLAGVKIFQETHRDVLLKTGGMSPEQKRFADAVGLNYKDLGWRSGPDYYDDLHSCRMSLHVTLSESFGFSVMDAMLLDTPTLVSPTVSWVPRGVGLVCQDPSDPTAIANAISELYFTEPPPEVRPTALAVAERRNETLKASMDGWQNRL